MHFSLMMGKNSEKHAFSLTNLSNIIFFLNKS